MKVLWLAPFPYIDGTHSRPAPWVITLAKALINSGIDLTILNYNSKIKEDIIKKEFEGIHLIYVKAPKLKKDLLTFYRVRINIMKNYLQTIIDNYDLLHIHGSEHQYEVMAVDLKVPKMISIQGIISEVIKVAPFTDFKKYIAWKLSSFYEKKYLPQYKYFSCRTHWDSNYIKSINPKAKVYNIWEMIRKDFFKDHFSNKKKNILFVGGKNSIKGLMELLQAYDSSLQAKGLKLIILGRCTIKDIEEIIQKQNLSTININNIDCRGLQNDVLGIIKAYDESFCLVHPSYIDNSPNSVCEAQISGLPVIATNVGGVASLIKDEETGLLIGRDSNDIVLAVERLLEDDKLRKKLSEKSRLIARDRHDPDIILNETLNMYSDIVNDKS